MGVSAILIELRNVSKRYRLAGGGVDALRGVSLGMRSGEFLAVIGSSGSGKSTLMNIVGCLDRPSGGSYLFDGRDVGAMSAGERASLRGSKIGFVFQDFNLLGRMTALENVEMPLTLRGEQPSTRREKAMDALREVGLERRTQHRPHELSGGQQQRVAIARALVTHPSLILADEPTGNLDRRSATVVMDTLCELNRRGATVLLITHDAEVAARARRTIRLADGRIEE